MRLLIILVWFVYELEVQLALVALTGYAGLQANASRLLAGKYTAIDEEGIWAARAIVEAGINQDRWQRGSTCTTGSKGRVTGTGVIFVIS